MLMPLDVGWAQENAEAAVLRACPPDSAEATRVVDRILGASGSAPGSQDRFELVAQLEILTDPRIERYWQLTAIINGWPPFPSHMPAFEWMIARCGPAIDAGRHRFRSRPRAAKGG
jgi:hypothetical protein